MKLSAYRPCPGDIIDGSIAFLFYLYDIDIDNRQIIHKCISYYQIYGVTIINTSTYSLNNPYGSSGIIT